MKKINLKGISEILSEKELKNVMGGSGSSGTCGYGGGSMGSQCGVSQAYAQQMQREFGGYWCCDSCGSTSYCG